MIQAQYEVLDKIAQRFGHCADMTTDLHHRIQQAYQELANGGWQGRGVLAFTAELDNTLFPAMQRLIHGLQKAQAATLEVKAIFKQAEEQATLHFGQEVHSSPLLASLGPIPAALFPGWWFGASSPPEDAYVIKKEDLKRYRGKANGTGKHKGQCAALPQAHFGKKLGPTREWRPGASLMDHPDLEYGTVIATFDKAGENGRYPNKKHGNHVALFLYYVKNKDGQIIGIRVLDQWGGRVAKERTLEYLSPEEAKEARSPATRDDAGLLVDKVNDMYVVSNPSRQPASP